MRILFGSISMRRDPKSRHITGLLEDYYHRCQRYVSCESLAFSSEDRLLTSLDTGQRTRPALVVADSRGKQLSSEEFASLLGHLLDRGTQMIMLAIGPADGWSRQALARADHSIAFGRITLPHELAAVVLAEQVYRALTIRAGHPYHSGH